LTSGELADGYYKSRVLDLTLQAEGPWRIKFLGTMNRDAVGGSAENPTQQGDVGCVGAEVNVKMLSVACDQSLAQDAGLGKIGDMPEQSTF